MQEEKLTPAKEYLDQIKEDDDVVILHHWDMDGISSSAIISKILEKTRGKPADTVKIPSQRAYHLEEEDEELIEQADKLIILDFNLEAEELEQVQEELNTPVLVVDHHEFDEIPEQVAFVNPRQYDKEVYIPCSKITYEIATLYEMEDEIRWIAGLGIIQDFGADSSPEIFQKLKEGHQALFPEEITQENLAKKCEYGRYSSVLNIKPYKNSHHYSKLAYKALMKSKSLEELEAQEEYRKVYKVYLEMQDEFNRVMEDYEEEREIDRENMIIFFELQSDFNITSSIATNMSTKTPDWIHLVIQEKDEINISARCQSGRVNLGELLLEALPEEALEDGAEAGGHKKAAGASMKEEYLPEFKQNFTELVP